MKIAKTLDFTAEKFSVCLKENCPNLCWLSSQESTVTLPNKPFNSLLNIFCCQADVFA